MKNANDFVRPCVLAISVGFLNMAQAQANDAPNLATVQVTGRVDSLTQGSIDSAKEMVKAIPGGASVVDLNQVRESKDAPLRNQIGLE